MILVYKNPKELPTAVFVKHPSRIANLIPPVLLGQSHPYEIIHTVVLGKIDYDNLITDLKADRWYIDEHKHESIIHEGVWRCILVQQKGYSDGVLVMSDGCDYPKWAAYLPGDRDAKLQDEEGGDTRPVTG